MYAVIVQYRDDDSEVVVCSRDLDSIRKEYWEWVRYFANSKLKRDPAVYKTYRMALRSAMLTVQLVQVKEV